MDERNRQRIQEHLRDAGAQERIQRYMEKGRAEASVTISRAAELFQLSENRLRDWEEYGLLSPLRPTGPKGRRLYTPGELDKLAVIRELIDAGYSPGDIPTDIDLVWHTIYGEREHPLLIDQRGLPGGAGNHEKGMQLSIPLRIDRERSEMFWRYFVSRALRLSLMLICEDIPHTTAALILPLKPPVPVETIQSVVESAKLGESLIGWLDQGHSSHTLLVAAPTFDYATDYRLLPLTVMTEDRVEEAVQDNTLILLDRRSRRLTLTAPMVAVIRQLLRPIYEEAQRSRSCFGIGMRDVMEPATDLENIDSDEDIALKGLADVIVEVGGKTLYGEPRWKFCCILLPNYPASVLSLQQRALVVRAQSALSPYKVGVTAVHPLGSAIGPCLRAFQSGHIVSQAIISGEDVALARAEENTILARNDESASVRSAIAVPVDGPDGMSIAVIYVAASTPHAFSENDQRALRLMGNMVGELLTTYSIRLRPMGKLRDLIAAPGSVDPLFREFLAEDDFALHVEGILRDAMKGTEDQPRDVLSFIALDIDNQSSLANKYGDRMARDISRAVGLRILGQLRAFKDEGKCEFYRVNADRFYLVLQGIPLEQTRARAELLRKVLKGSYQIDPQRAPIGQPTLPENMVTLSNITVRLAVSSYLYGKLREILQRYSTENAIVEARLLLMRFLDEGLDIGKRAGGDVVMSWDPHNRGIVSMSSPG